MKSTFGIRRPKHWADLRGERLADADLIVVPQALKGPAAVSVPPDRFRWRQASDDRNRQLAAHVHYPGRAAACEPALSPLFERLQGGACAVIFADPADEGGLALCLELLRCQHTFAGLQQVAGEGADAVEHFLETSYAIAQSQGRHGLDFPVPIARLRGRGDVPFDRDAGVRLEWGFIWQLDWEPFLSTLWAEIDKLLRVLGELYVTSGGRFDRRGQPGEPGAEALEKADTLMLRLLCSRAWWESLDHSDEDPGGFADRALKAFRVRAASLFRRLFRRDLLPADSLAAGTEPLAPVDLAALRRFQAAVSTDEFNLLPRLNQPGPAMLALDQTTRRLETLGDRVLVLERDRLGWPVAFAIATGRGCLAVLPATIPERAFTTALRELGERTGKRGMELTKAYAAGDGHETTEASPPRKEAQRPAPGEETPGGTTGADRLLNTIQAAKYLGVSRPTFYRLRQKTQVPTCRVGGMDRFRQSELDRTLVTPKRTRRPPSHGAEEGRNH